MPPLSLSLAGARPLPSRNRLALIAVGLAIVGLLWTAAASAVFLWGTGLVRFFPLEGVAWLTQWWRYALFAPPNPIVSRWLLLGAAAPTAFLGLVIYRVLQFRGSRAVKPGRVVRGVTDNHGHAAWMSMQEARQRFPGPDPEFGGIVVGEAYRVDEDRVAGLSFDPDDPKTWGQGGKAPLLIDPCRTGPGHRVMIAGSGGFKTVCAATTLAHWTGPAAVLDPSRELGPMLTAARLAMGHKVVALEPGKPGGINVLDWIDITHPLAVINLNAVVGWIFGETDPGGSDDEKFFRQWGKQLVACLLAHMLWDDTLPPHAKTLRTLRAALATPEDQMRDLLEAIHTGSRSSTARDLAGSIKKFVPETFSGIYGNANGQTGWLSVAAYADLVSGGPEGAEASFHTRDLTAGQLTVFLQIPLKVLQDTPAVGRVLVGALTNSVYEADGDVRGRVLFLLDEVARLGRMKILETARDAGRKYRITMQLLYQSEDQLIEQWGRHGRNAWFDSVSWRMYAGIQNPDTAKSVSDAAGGHAVIAESAGDNRGSQGKMLETGSRSKGSSTNRHELSRALIRPDELLQDVRTDEAFVFARNAKPLRCGRAIYFRRPELRDVIGVSRFHQGGGE
jgi:type IV secretion system protein VirD4